MAGRGGEDVRGHADQGAAGRTSGTDADTTRRTQQIRAEIEHTREDLSETIDAIQERLRPGNIVSEATDRVKTATNERMKNMASSAGEAAGGVIQQTRETAGQLVEGARSNPVPAILIGVGTTWLLMNRGSEAGGRRRAAGHRAEYAGDYTRGVYGDEGSWETEPGSGWLDRIKRNPVPAVMAGAGLAWLAFANGRESDDRYGARWSSAEQRWSGDEGEGIAGVTRDLTSRAQEMASGAGTAISRRTRRTQNQLQRLMRENPLLVGAAAVVVGAAVGMALPETEKENEWLGDARDSVVDRAQDLARDAASKVREAAGDLAADVVKGKE